MFAKRFSLISARLISASCQTVALLTLVLITFCPNSSQAQQYHTPLHAGPFTTNDLPFTECVDDWVGPGLPFSLPNWQWTFLPKGNLYGTYWASEAEPRLSTRVTHEFGQGSFVDSMIGGRIGLVRFGSRNRLEGWQLDLLGGAKLRQSLNEGLDVQATDYRFDLPLTYRYGPHAFKTGYYHVSSHLGDEFLLKNPGFDRLNFLRDAFVLGYSYHPIPELRLYSEVGYGFHVEISEPWEFQFGFDYGPAAPTGISGHPFVAMNGHLREELNYGGNFAAQAGWAWRGEGLSAGTLRTGLYYFNGASSQFSFYSEHEQIIGWGLWYDF